MPSLENPLVVTIIATVIGGLILAALVPIGRRLWQKFFRPELRIIAATEQGPTSRALGFAEPAVKITVMNKSNDDIQIKDIRLMLCGVFGAPLAPNAPAGRSHRELPVSLAPGVDEHWYIPAEKLSDLLRSLHYPPKTTVTATRNVMLYTRCITGTDKIYKGHPFPSLRTQAPTGRRDRNLCHAQSHRSAKPDSWS